MMKPSVRLPLEGLRILAVSQFGAGPYATMVLADLGADVVKIEDPRSGGDVSRSVPPYQIPGDSIYFQSFNRNKRSITLDLRTPEGRALFHRLVAVSHAVFNNLRGDETHKLGLDYESLREINPRVVCCSLSGFGRSGARAHEPGYDYLIQAATGYMSMTGDPAGPPVSCGVSVIDYASGLAAALGLVAAVSAARETGQGSDVEVSLYDVAISMLTYLGAWNLNRGFEPTRRSGSAHQTLVPAQTFRTADGHIVLFCAKEKFWRKLCEALGAPEMAGREGFRNFGERYESRDAVIETIQSILATKTTEEWITRFQGQVPCAPVRDLTSALSDPFTHEREMIVETDHPEFGKVRQVAGPVKIPGAKKSHHRAPKLGEHTEEILKDWLGLSAEEIAEMNGKGEV
ncbi:MAG: CoA transferase [Acidobacteriota bacterium]|nr:CoA transferase [Acidobacteriota bacterium]